MSDYRQELNARLSSAQKRVRLGVAARTLKESDEGKMVMSVIDDEISLEVTKQNSTKPLPHDEYLSSHGKVQGLKRIRDMVNAKESDHAGAVAEVKTIRDQIKDFDAQQPKQNS